MFIYTFLPIFVCLFKKYCNFAACFILYGMKCQSKDAVYIKITSITGEKLSAKP